MHGKFSSGCWWSLMISIWARFHTVIWSDAYRSIEMLLLHALAWEIEFACMYLWYLCIGSIPYDAIICHCNVHDRACMQLTQQSPLLAHERTSGHVQQVQQVQHKSFDCVQMRSVWTQNIRRQWTADRQWDQQLAPTLLALWVAYAFHVGLRFLEKMLPKHHATMLQSLDSELVSDLCVKHALLEQTGLPPILHASLSQGMVLKCQIILNPFELYIYIWSWPHTAWWQCHRDYPKDSAEVRLLKLGARVISKDLCKTS